MTRQAVESELDNNPLCQLDKGDCQMIKARKQDIARLERISSELNHGLDLLMSDKYQIMTPSRLTSTDVFTASFYPNERYNKIAKQYGNELCRMFTAIQDLSNLLKGDSNHL